MFARILKTVDGFLRFKKNESPSKLEQIGDFFMSPIRLVFNGRSFEYLSDGNKIFCYSYTDDIGGYDPNRVSRPKRFAYGILLPLALIGILFKLIGLIFSENRQHLTEWETPIKFVGTNSFGQTWWELGVRPKQFLANEIDKRGLMHILIEKYLKNPNKYFGNLRIKDNANEYAIPLLNISE